MTRDARDELEVRLFDAGRDELPSEARLARIRASVRREVGVETREVHRRKWSARTRFGAALLAAIALAGVAAVGVTVRWGEKLHITADRATVPTEAPAHEPPAPAAVPTERKVSPASRIPRPATAAPAEATLADELESLQRARALLGKGDARQALKELARFDGVLKGRQMQAEAQMLRIEAVAQQGQRDEARELARQFVIEHPNHPLADRARVFVSGVDGGAAGDGGNREQQE